MLLNINLRGDLRSNYKWTNKYDIAMHYEKLSMVFMIPVLTFYIIFIYIKLNVPLFVWIFMICLNILAILYCIYYYKKIYRSNMDAIVKSLEEINEP